MATGEARLRMWSIRGIRTGSIRNLLSRWHTSPPEALCR